MRTCFIAGEAEPSLRGTGTEDYFCDGWGMRQLAAGDHVLRFECAGKPATGDGYGLGFDTLAARVPVYSRPLDFDLRKIQK